jgi:hypothetical protein
MAGWKSRDHGFLWGGLIVVVAFAVWMASTGKLNVVGGLFVLTLGVWFVALIVKARMGDAAIERMMTSAVSAEEGAATLEKIDTNENVPPRYNLTIGARTFQVSEAAFKTFKAGAHYRVYFLSGKVLSFERVGPDDAGVDRPTDAASIETATDAADAHKRVPTGGKV